MAHLGVTMTPQPLLALLLVDDEPSFVSGLARLLRRDGYTVGTAANGQSALPLLQEHPWDMILCDLRMPELDGPDFYALLGRQYPALCQRVIFSRGIP
jgi:CheY-like chemotaxis protein